MWIRLQMLVSVLRGDRLPATAARHPQDVGVVAVAADVRADDAMALLIAVLQDRCAGPSPNSTQVFRSVQFVMELSLLGPDDQHGVVRVGGDELLPISSATRKPEHAADTSSAAALLAPIFVCTKHASQERSCQATPSREGSGRCQPQ
jgi:hypothetical protein